MKMISAERMTRESATRNPKGAGDMLSRLIHKLADFELIDGDAFLESKDWPYVWKTAKRK